MAFLVGSIQLQIYTDTSQTEFPLQNLPTIENDFTNSAVTDCQPLFFNLAASTAKTINFNGLTGITQFYLFSDTTALTVAINGGSAIAYAAAVPGYIPLAATSLVITNASSTTATNVTLILIKG